MADAAGCCTIASMGRKRGWTDEQFTAAVTASRSTAQVLKALGLNPTGANYVTVRLHAQRLGLSTSHFLGQRWNVGVSPGKVIPLEVILVQASTYTNLDRLKKRLIRAGLLEEHCYECGLTEWRGKPIALQLEHRNGDNRDHRIGNLCLLCPNCHSQTATFAGRNQGRVSPILAELACSNQVG
jgi:hypothetical protein